jgi:isopentenyldiphosphate isomerase
MKRLKQQIHESFFNPVLHFLPLLVFMVVDDFWGLGAAWGISLAVCLILFLYIYFGYRKIAQWFLFSTIIYGLVALISTLIPTDTFSTRFTTIVTEIVVVVVFIISLILRPQIESFIQKQNKKMLPMVNNMNELFRMIWILGVLILIYVHVFLYFNYINPTTNESVFSFIHTSYLLILFFILFFELIRVTLVRIRLLREEWWPIVNEQGKMIGSIQYQASLAEEKKYMHPVVRLMLIDNNRIYLNKRKTDDMSSPGMWDTTICSHVRVTEKIENCIERVGEEQLRIKQLKPLFLSNYIHETEFESQYVFLFVACRHSELSADSSSIDSAKWWTLQQIEDNIDSNIFTDSFKSELDILKRSGLLESNNCDCNCKLKEMVSENQTSG